MNICLQTSASIERRTDLPTFGNTLSGVASRAVAPGRINAEDRHFAAVADARAAEPGFRIVGQGFLLAGRRGWPQRLAAEAGRRGFQNLKKQDYFFFFSGAGG